MTNGHPKKFIIYKIINQINNKIYIGQTIKTLEQRWTRHVDNARNGSECIIHRAIRKYGKDNFLLKILFYCTSKEEANKKEIETISKLSAKVPIGYNATNGGGGSVGCIASDATRKKMSMSKLGYIASDATRKRMSMSKLGNENRLGCKTTDETKAKLSIAMTGHKYWGPATRTDEWKAMISATNKGKQYRLGHKFTEEHKEKLKIAGLKHRHTEQSKAKMRASWIIRKQHAVQLGGV